MKPNGRCDHSDSGGSEDDDGGGDSGLLAATPSAFGTAAERLAAQLQLRSPAQRAAREEKKPAERDHLCQCHCHSEALGFPAGTAGAAGAGSGWAEPCLSPADAAGVLARKGGGSDPHASPSPSAYQRFNPLQAFLVLHEV